MTDQAQPQLHDDVLIAVRRLFPRCAKFTPFVWQQIAAIAGDDYRPEISDQHYRSLLELKVRYAVEGDSTQLHRDVSSLRSQLVKLLPSKGWDQFPPAFIYREVVAFDDFVMAQEELPVLESLMLETTGKEKGIDLLQ